MINSFVEDWKWKKEFYSFVEVVPMVNQVETHILHQQENFNVFVLNDRDMQKLAGLDEEESAFFSHYNPETVEYIIGLCK